MVFNMVKVSFLDILDYISHKPECYVFLCPVQVPLKGLPAGGNEISIREGIQKKKLFFWEIFPKCVYLPTHPRVFVRFGNTKGEFLFVQNL